LICISALTHYVVVRSDIPIGAASAQIVHAAGESSSGNLPPNTFAVVLAADSEDVILKLSAQLYLQNIKHIVVREPDAPWYNQAMAIGVYPQLRENVRRAFRHLRLYKGQANERQCLPSDHRSYSSNGEGIKGVKEALP